MNRHVAESSQSGNVCGIIVPLEQVKAFFDRTEAETAVPLSAADPDLILDLGHEPSNVKIRFIETSRSWNDYEKLLKSLPNQEHNTTSSTERVLKSTKLTKAEKKRRTQMQNRLNMLKSATELVGAGGDYAFFSIDIESWEKNHDIITEIGLTRYLPEPSNEAIARDTEISSEHIIIKEHRFYKNGDYVADASGNFEFGNTRYVPLANLKADIASFMSTPSTKERQFVLVGHDVNVDIEYLRKLGCNLEANNFAMVFDTVEMWKAMAGSSNGISLGRLCAQLDIAAWNLHNAGNDARYTMGAFIEMARRFRMDPEMQEVQT
ncbi:hypothetical protein TWF694_007981 [Orbilia ellipsospora]|uniref:Gfd2/YDR514C-like C-terminal domain-containing protein n=1 Tax=Orbilia ellipsospora TaxID=2528407 RepID=A0AAV9XMR7_9PEZI